MPELRSITWVSLVMPPPTAAYPQWGSQASRQQQAARQCLEQRGCPAWIYPRGREHVLSWDSQNGCRREGHPRPGIQDRPHSQLRAVQRKHCSLSGTSRRAELQPGSTWGGQGQLCYHLTRGWIPCVSPLGIHITSSSGKTNDNEI